MSKHCEIKSIITELKLIFDKTPINTWSHKMRPYGMLLEVEWLVKEQQKLGNF